MTETIEVCPECGSSSLYNNNPESYRGGGTAKRFGCYGCKATFDEPDERERRGAVNIRGDTLAAKLDAAEPDDVRGGA